MDGVRGRLGLATEPSSLRVPFGLPLFRLVYLTPPPSSIPPPKIGQLTTQSDRLAALLAPLLPFLPLVQFSLLAFLVVAGQEALEASLRDGWRESWMV